MANFLNYIIESSIQPVKTNVLWIKNGVPYYFNKKWKPLLGGGSGEGTTIDFPIIVGEHYNSALLRDSNNKAFGESSVALGKGVTTNNIGEAAFGLFNKSVESLDPSKATLFTIGNGTENTLKNAFEVRYDNSIYIDGIDTSIQRYLKYLKLANDILDSEFSEAVKDINNSIKETNSKITQFEEQIQLIAESVTKVNDRITEQGTSITQNSAKIELLASKNEELENKILENSSKIKQTADNIISEVSRLETKYDEKFIKTNQSISKIDQKADSISLRVEEIVTVTDDLQNQITENKTSINQTSNSIDILVQETKTLSDRITDNEAAIEVNKESIKSKVEQSIFDIYSGEVSNQFSEVNQTIEGVTNTVKDNSGKIIEIKTSIDGLTVKTGTLEAEIESLKKQSDGLIDTHFGTTTPTLENEPAINWTEEDKQQHTGDIYYNNNTGEAYRFSFDPITNTYFWVELTDSALSDALDKISKLEGSIDGKSSIYIKDITDSSIKYKLGDIWILPEKIGIYDKGTLLSCKKDFNLIFDWNDWEELIKYTDNSELNSFKESYNTTINSIQTQIDKKAETWYQEEDPSESWNTDNLKSLHLGDLWYNTSTQETFYWNGLVWELQNIPKEIFDTIDSKSSIFVAKPESYQVNDIWVLEADYVLNEVKYKKGTWVVAIESSDVWNANHWVKKDLYTDDTAVIELNSYIDGAFSDNILEDREKSIIKESKKTFDSKFDEITSEYTQLLLSSFATNSIYKDNLKTAYENLEESKTLLDKAVTNILNHSVNSITSLEELKNNYDLEYINFVKKLQDYRTIVEQLKESINVELNGANIYISEIASDGIVSTIEKKQLLNVWQTISTEFNTNKGIAVNYKIIDEDGNYTTLYDSSYYQIYKEYEDSYKNLVTIFQIFDLTNLNNSTVLPEGYSISETNTKLDVYYTKLQAFSELISKITIEITDAHDKAIAIANSWQEHLHPNDEITQIGKGLVLSTVIGVQSDGILEAALNASDDIPGTTNENHGRIIFAGGIGGSEDWNDATTIIYEDGYVKFVYGEIGEGINLGGALIHSVVSGQIDLLSYPENGKLIPLFQVNKDENGKIVSISSLFDLNVNGNLAALGEVSAGGSGTEGGNGGGGLGFEDLQWYLDQNKYVKEEDIAQLIPDNIATKDDVEERIAEVIAGAPEALDTLKEIADALAQNQDEIGAIFDAISKKASKEELKAVDDKHSASIAAINTKDTQQDQAIADLVAKDASIESSITEIKGKDEEQDRELDSIEGRLAEAEKITALFGEDEDGNVYVKNSKNFYTLGEISAGGAGTAGGGGGGSDVGGGYLDSLYDVELNEITIDANLSAAEKEAVTESQVLGYDFKGLWVNKKTMYIHHQNESSTDWVIAHGMNKMPNVKVLDSTGELVYGTVTYNGFNEVKIHFSGSFSGKAYLD